MPMALFRVKSLSMDVSIVVSWLYTYPQTHQIVYIKYV